MKLSIDSSRLPDYLTRQIEQCFPDGNERWQSDVRHCCSVALERIEYCFRHIPKKYYQDQGEPVFNHMNADHYASFLYFVSYQAAQAGNEALAERAFYLNKALHGLDLSDVLADFLEDFIRSLNICPCSDGKAPPTSESHSGSQAWR